MRTAVVEGVTLAWEEAGEGEPVVCIHGAFVADAFRPLFAQADLTERYRLIAYHRRGYAGSSPASATLGLADQAADCRRLLDHLGIPRAHVVGHSFGGAVALQLALDESRLVATLTLLEPALAVGASGEGYREGLRQSIGRYRETGARAAVDSFLELRWPAYADALERVLPGSFEQAVDAAGSAFDSELPTVLELRFGEAEARRIDVPALLVLGERSAALDPRFAETHRLLLEWLPAAEGAVLPGATHFLQIEAPDAAAALLGDFLARHLRLPGHASRGRG